MSRVVETASEFVRIKIDSSIATRLSDVRLQLT